ncbi:SDR family NAD(P)-dependent oxidoreductase [Nocardioides sp. GCM10027113]|uniref:SDR family NAD(P)-dependent oxidoreductase n=1 Tax=unclassified Nocardioides TaxID=2615069 RepID=UPI00360B3C49
MTATTALTAVTALTTPAADRLLDLSGEVAVVTGASQGIGAAVARRLAEAGAAVVVHHRRNRAGAERVVHAIDAAGGRAVAAPAELTDPDAVRTLLTEAPDRLGGLSVLVNCAGTYPSRALADLDPDAWVATLSDSLTSTFLTTRAAIAPMRRRGGGSIVNVASLSALVPGPAHSHYNSAKAAVVMLTRSSAQELGADGIRVNAVSPGLVSRPGLEDEWPDGVARWRARAPLVRVGDPADVADAVLFLASRAARWITGHNLVVDGGMTAAPPY